MPGRRSTILLALVLLLAVPAAAHAAAPGAPVVAGLFGSIGKAIVGTLEFTVDLFKDLFLNMLGGLADMLIPDSWAKKGTEFLRWIVAVPDFSHSAFGPLRGIGKISVWIGLAMLPVTLSVSLGLPSLGFSGSGEAPAEIIARTGLAVVGLVLLVPLMSQGAALANQISSAYTTSGEAIAGMNAYLELLVGSAILKAIPFMGMLIMIVAGGLFLGVLVLKTMLLLVGALLFASAGLLLGAIPTRRGTQLARTWFTALLATWSLPIIWGLIFVVAGTLLKHAPAVGQAVGGTSGFGAVGGMLIAGAAAIVGPMLCISMTRTVLGPLGSQLSSAMASVSPGRMASRVSTAAPRTGAVGGAPRSVASTGAAAAGGPAGMMGRLAAASRAGLGAARAGAANTYRAPSGGGQMPFPRARAAAATAAGPAAAAARYAAKRGPVGMAADGARKTTTAAVTQAGRAAGKVATPVAAAVARQHNPSTAAAAAAGATAGASAGAAGAAASRAATAKTATPPTATPRQTGTQPGSTASSGTAGSSAPRRSNPARSAGGGAAAPKSSAPRDSSRQDAPRSTPSSSARKGTPRPPAPNKPRHRPVRPHRRPRNKPNGGEKQ